MLDKLKVNPDNPRFIRGDAFEKLVNSIRDFPDMLAKRPIVYDESNTILGGNMRYMALKELVKEGFEVKDEYFKQVTDWTEEQKREFVIKDNVALGEWDTDILANKWDDLPLEDWGIDTTGWDNEEVEEDEVPELSEEAVSKLGEVYLLGRHRLMCGDSTKIEDVEKLMNGQKADMVFTDPPYGNADSGKYGRGQLGIRTIKGDEDTSVLKDAVSSKYSDVLIFFLQWRTIKELIQHLEDNQIALGTVAVWDKKNAGLSGGGGLAEQWEAILFCGDIKYKKFGGNVFSISREVLGRDNRPHPHMKPIKLLAEILNFVEGDTVLDLFGGSGSTLIACEQLGRNCYMMELDPIYVDVIRKRYAKFIGKEEEWQTITPAIE